MVNDSGKYSQAPLVPLEIIEIVNALLQKLRDGKAAEQFFKRLLPQHKGEPRKGVTVKLRSYGIAHMDLMPDTIHYTSQYANNRCELSYESNRVRGRVYVN